MKRIIFRKIVSSICFTWLLAIVVGCTGTSASIDVPVSIPPTSTAEEIAQGRACPDAGRPIQDPIVLNQSENLVTVSASGGHITQLTTLPINTRVYAPTWSPDGQTLAFGFFFLMPDPALSWLQTGIICGMDRKTGQGRVLARGATMAESFEEATWTPDGKALVLTRLMHIFNEKKELAKTEVAIVRYDLQTQAIETLIPNAIRPALSPDGQQLAYVKIAEQQGRIDRILAVAQANGQQERTLLGPANGFYQLDSPRWSPDGSRLAFSASTGPAIGQRQPQKRSWWDWITGVAVVEAHGDPSHLWLIKSDGQDVQQLTAEASDDPHAAWSPDGQKLVYVTTLGAVTMLDINNRTEQQLTQEGFAGLVDWRWQ